MMTKNADKKREQMMMFSMDSMVPQDHMLRLIDKAINWNFIYDLVEEKYCPDNGRPSMDPVMLPTVGFLVWICWILYRIFQRLERTIPADLKTRIFLNRYFQRFWKNV